MNTPADVVTGFEAQRAERARLRRRQAGLALAVFGVVVGAAAWQAQVRPGEMLQNLPALGAYLYKTAPTLRVDHLFTDLAAWYWNLGPWLMLLWDTVLMAFLGTVLGASGALLVSFPATRGLGQPWWVTWVARRVLEVARGVPDLVYAMVLVFAFGIGPLPGVLALAIHSFGALGKLFSEVNENVNATATDGIYASGGTWTQAMRLGVLPRVLPDLLSYSLLRFEINVRSASVLGFVGAGGIGQELRFVIEQFVYTDISALVLLIIVAVSLIDIGCERLRHGLIGAGVRDDG